MVGAGKRQRQPEARKLERENETQRHRQTEKDRHRDRQTQTLADPELQKQGGANILPEFFDDFFEAFLEKMSAFPQKCHLSPKISDDFFF